MKEGKGRKDEGLRDDGFLGGIGLTATSVGSCAAPRAQARVGHLSRGLLLGPRRGHLHGALASDRATALCAVGPVPGAFSGSRFLFLGSPLCAVSVLPRFVVVASSSESHPSFYLASSFTSHHPPFVSAPLLGFLSPGPGSRTPSPS